ncbi:MAG TPA: Bax inhibitor-1/YccA family protein [Ilumatobacteraceae bacterium]|nr:Bax inhibitor-1/YccA family protein [Ilumatobacteraceae bacterium]
MANPIFNETTWNKAARNPGWGAPDPSTRATPITDGPVSAWHSQVMTVGGTISAAGVLMVVLLAAAVVGWQSGPDNQVGQTGFPALALGGILVGFACVIAMYFRPMWAKVLAPVYALGEGFFLGVISKAYENYQNGIVVQAVGATLGVFAVMLILYRTKIIKVTDRFRRIVITATMGLMAFYLVSFVISLIGGSGSVSFLNSASALGILFSVFAAGLAAMNLAIDFDFIERGVKQGLPKGMEWFAAFALIVTLVWLYLELLRLLSKLQRR